VLGLVVTLNSNHFLVGYTWQQGERALSHHFIIRYLKKKIKDAENFISRNIFFHLSVISWFFYTVVWIPLCGKTRQA